MQPARTYIGGAEEIQGPIYEDLLENRFSLSGHDRLNVRHIDQSYARLLAQTADRSVPRDSA